jgi:hypothetical protein
MSAIFSIRDKKVVLNTHVLQIPEFKAVVDEFPKEYLNVFGYINGMTNPLKEENPHLECRPSEKESKLRKDFPGNYTGDHPVVVLAMKRMVEDFIDLPEDRMYEAAKIAAEALEVSLRTVQVTSLSDMKTLADIFPKIEKAMEALGKTREARASARHGEKGKGGVEPAYDEEE